MSGINFVMSDTEAFLRHDYVLNSKLNSPTIYVFPDVVSAAESRRLLLDETRAVNGSRFITLESLAEGIVREAMAVQPMLIHDSISEIIARDVLKTLQESGSQLSLSFSDAMLRDYTAVRQFYEGSRKWLSEIVSGSGIVLPEGALERRIRPIEEFSALFEKSMDAAEHRCLFDRTTLIRRATVNTDVLRKMGIGRIVLLFLTYADASVMSFVEALAVKAEVVVVIDRCMEELESVRSLLTSLKVKPENEGKPSPHSKSEVSFFGAPDRRRELIEVARRIRREIAERGLAESDFAVLARNIADYHDLANEIFGEYGLRIEGGRKRSLADTPVFEFVRRFLRCLTPDSGRKDMFRLVMHELSPIGREDVGPVSEMTELMPERLDAWNGALTALKRTQRGSFGGLDTAFMESVLRLRSSGREIDSLSGWTEMLRKVASHAHVGEQNSTEAGSFILAVDEMSAYAVPLTEVMHHRRMTLDEFTGFLERFCSSKTLPPPMRDRGILLTDVGIVYVQSFRHCFILGMNDGVFPADPAEGAFLTQSIIDTLARSGFVTRRSSVYHSSTESYYYSRAKSLAAEVTLSYLTSDSEGRKMLPSRFVVEDCAGEVPAGERLEWLDRGSIPAGHFFPSGEESVLLTAELRPVLADRLREDADFLKEEDNMELWNMCGGPEAGAFLEAVRRINVTPLPWKLSAENASRRSRMSLLSPSDLNEYVLCPFRFFLTRVLRLYPPEEIFGFKSRGTDAHEILKSYFSGIKLEEFRKESDESISAAVDSLVADRYRTEYGEQCMGDFGTVVGMDTLASVLKKFLMKERTIQASLSSDVIMIERNFGFGDAPLKIGAYEFRGKIDRVDALYPGSRDVVLFDYKFTRPDALRLRHFNSTMDRPKNFEVPIYSLYLKDVLGYNIAGAMYYSLPKSGGKFDRAGLVNESKAIYFIPDLPKRKNTQISVLSESELEETFGKYRAWITATAKDIQDGKFPVTPEERECEYCGYKAFCRNWSGSAE